MFATYLPPLSSLSAAINVPAANRTTRVPQEVLTDALVKEIKTRCCLVGKMLSFWNEPRREATPVEDEGSEMDIPPSDSSDISQLSSQPDSEYAVILNSRRAEADRPEETHLQALSSMCLRNSTATDVQMRVIPPPLQQTGTGRGTLIIPGWIRE